MLEHPSVTFGIGAVVFAVIIGSGFYLLAQMMKTRHAAVVKGTENMTHQGYGHYPPYERPEGAYDPGRETDTEEFPEVEGNVVDRPDPGEDDRSYRRSLTLVVVLAIIGMAVCGVAGWAVGNSNDDDSTPAKPTTQRSQPVSQPVQVHADLLKDAEAAQQAMDTLGLRRTNAGFKRYVEWLHVRNELLAVKSGQVQMWNLEPPQ